MKTRSITKKLQLHFVLYIYPIITSPKILLKYSVISMCLYAPKTNTIRVVSLWLFTSYFIFIIQLRETFVHSSEFVFNGPFMNICKDGLETIDPGCCSSEIGRYRFLRNETIVDNDLICITDAITIGKVSR